ncbi:uncharacterized protein Dvir_GJ21294 [Drosophila virilis]|uniref:MD-2-related lipid-recognition domain-containing protein n=1 Tax=Drosophila virilis TaxID=7244 RepID=B4LN89_DROVI|nr:uncharacterized protein Dvir_GJ21294 [Drosophila virilis]
MGIRLIVFGLLLTLLVLNISYNPIVGNVDVKGQLFKRANGYKPWLYKATIDGCRFLKKPYHPLAILVYKIFKSYTNLNHTCPYEGLVLIKDLYLKLENLPHAIPTGEYLLRLDWCINKNIQIRSDVYFAFVEDL